MAKRKTMARMKAPSFVPKTEEEFMEYQEAYLKYLRYVNSLGTASERKAVAKATTEQWIKAGIMTKDGKIAKRYERVIVSQ